MRQTKISCIIKAAWRLQDRTLLDDVLPGLNRTTYVGIRIRETHFQHVGGKTINFGAEAIRM